MQNLSSNFSAIVTREQVALYLMVSLPKWAGLQSQANFSPTKLNCVLQCHHEIRGAGRV